MANEIIKELWKIKDDIAEEFGYDVKAFVSKLRAKKKEEDKRIVDHREKNELMDRADQASC
ncbi:MAG: hypothetical protein HY787_29515 [Deltaproteobacteria bacterium]|nr:hypothetical protein [Deltaproteobacteria bacterium]